MSERRSEKDGGGARAGHLGRRRGGAHDSEAVEDYAKAIHTLSRREAGAVSTSALAELLGVSPGSVTAMLKRMATMKLVEHQPYHGVSLTAEGERIALEVIRHHRLLEAYLADVLGMPWDKVHAEADVLEHYISEDLEERIAAALGHPSTDPHGDPIPDRQLALAGDSGISLDQLEVGREATISRVSDSDPEVLRFLDRCGMRPGAAVRVAAREAGGGTLTLAVAGSEQQIGDSVAARVVVAPSG